MSSRRRKITALNRANEKARRWRTDLKATGHWLPYRVWKAKQIARGKFQSHRKQPLEVMKCTNPGIVILRHKPSSIE